MPTYDYRCPANGRVVEVSHKLAERPCDTAPACAQPRCGGGGCAFDS